MRQNNALWFGSWFGRLLMRTMAHSLCGAIAAALVGAACIALAGAVTGTIIDIQGTPSSWNQGLIVPGAYIGAWLGGRGGGIAGALIGAFIGLTSAPGRRILPSGATLRAVALGQVGGTIGVCASFFTLQLVLSLAKGQTFPKSVDENVIWILMGAPALMMCGAVAGALWGLRRKKEAPQIV